MTAYCRKYCEHLANDFRWKFEKIIRICSIASAILNDWRHVFSTFSSTHRNDECLKCTRRIARLLLELDIKRHAFRSKNKMVRRTQYVHGLFYSLIGTWNANRPFISFVKQNQPKIKTRIQTNAWLHMMSESKKKKKKKKQSDVEKKECGMLNHLVMLNSVELLFRFVAAYSMYLLKTCVNVCNRWTNHWSFPQGNMMKTTI